MLLWATFDQNSVIVRVKILDSTVTTGAGKTGLTSASTGLIISTIADSEATATAYTVAGSTVETITTLGTYAAPTATKCRFKEVDATNHPGIYELQFADARFSIASAKSLLISISGATGAAQCDAVIPLPTMDLFDSVRAGLTALPNAVPGAAGGVFIAGTNAATAITTALTANITGNLSGSVGSLGATAKTDVNAEVVDALATDTYAEPGQEAPAATLSIAKKIGYLFKAWRNKSTQDATTYKLYADDAATVDQKATTSDDATTFTKGEVGTGP